MIKKLLESIILSAVQDDDGDIRYDGFNVNTGVANIQFAGSCDGCPSSSVSLRMV